MFFTTQQTKIIFILKDFLGFVDHLDNFIKR